MDLDMDMDFSDISDDKIRSFLSAKLEEIRLENKHLETVLHERQKALLQNTPKFQGDFRIENIWKKIFNCKYAIGFEIFNPQCFENVRVAITCDCDKLMCYEVHTFSVNSQDSPCIVAKNCEYLICDLVKKSDTFKDRAYVIITFNLPQFLDKLEYNISGHVTCTLDGRDIDMPFPSIQLLAKDTVYQTNWLNETNPLPNLFTVVCCTRATDLVLCFPEEWRTPLFNTFEIHCSLTYIPLMNKSYFLANKISDLFDNTLIIVHPHDFKEGAENDVYIKIYTSNDDQLFAFLHHLSSCIPNSIVFPSVFYQSVLLCKRALYKEEKKKDILKDFQQAMHSDLEHSYQYARIACWRTQLAENKTHKFNQLRKKLSESERVTDLHYLKVAKT